MAGQAVAEVFAAWAGGLETDAIPQAARDVARHALLDVAGLCIAARGMDYVGAALAAWDAEGPCTALGHRRGLDAAGAAFINGTAAHGEDFDDSFEGTPVHASAVVLPAVLAAAERYGRSGADLLRGYVVGSRADVPARPGGADRDPSRRLPSDRGDRRARRRRRRRRRAAPVATAADRCARHRRQHGVRDHRVSRRGHLDQAAARRLGGPGGPARGPARAPGLPRPAHRARGRARLLPGLRRPGDHARLPLRDGRSGRRLADGEDRLQALRLRHHAAPVHRLRHPAGAAKGSRPPRSTR